MRESADFGNYRKMMIFIVKQVKLE